MNLFYFNIISVKNEKKNVYSQLNKLKSGIKMVLKKLWKFHQMLLTDTQVSKFCKAFTNGSSANIKLIKT